MPSNTRAIPARGEYLSTTPDQGFEVRAWMVRELGLNGCELLVYAIIRSFAGDGGCKMLEWSFLSELTGSSVSTCRRAVDSLVEKGLVEKIAVRTEAGDRNVFRMAAA